MNQGGRIVWPGRGVLIQVLGAFEIAERSLRPGGSVCGTCDVALRFAHFTVESRPARLSHVRALGAITTMVGLTPRQRQVLADQLPDLANVCAALLVLGQLVGQQPLSPPLFVAGVALWAVLLAFALYLAGGTQ